MEDETRILQERIQITTIKGQTVITQERIGRKNNKADKSGEDIAQHRQDAGAESAGQGVGAHGDGYRPQAQNINPQQERAFMSAPNRGNAVIPRQQAIAVPGNVIEAEIVDIKSIYQGKKADAEQ